MPTTSKSVAAVATAGLIVSFLVPAAFAQSFDANVVTVEQLLKIDNANALSKVETFKVAGKPRSGSGSIEASKPTPAAVKLVKVTGRGDSPRFHFTYNGKPVENVPLGGKLVDKCHVVGFASQCVNLALTSDPKEKPAAFASRQRLVCPQAVCWSGLTPEGASLTAANGNSMNPIIPSVPMPAGMPQVQQR